MENSFETLQNINWFLKPISDLLLFLFTTQTGIIISVMFLCLFVIFTISNSLKIRNLAHRAANKGSIAFSEILYLTGSETIKIFLKIIGNLPVVLITILLTVGIVEFSTAIQKFDEYFTNQKKIEELSVIIKQLDDNYKVATIEIIDYDKINDVTKLSISYFDNSKNDYLAEKQEITINGNDIYFLAQVINFEYSQIETKNKKNIVIPIKIFSNKVASNDGINLNINNKNGIPYVFLKSEENIYGLSIENYNERIKQLFEIINNSEKAKLEGIRSFYEAAPHTFVAIEKGQRFSIWVEQTGGLVLKEEEVF